MQEGHVHASLSQRYAYVALREGISSPSGLAVAAAVVEIAEEEAKWGWRCHAEQPRRGRDGQERKIRRGRAMVSTS